MAEMAYAKSTNEELQGARKFVETFLNMSEEPQKSTGTPPLKDLGQKQQLETWFMDANDFSKKLGVTINQAIRDGTNPRQIVAMLLYRIIEIVNTDLKIQSTNDLKPKEIVIEDSGKTN